MIPTKILKTNNSKTLKAKNIILSTYWHQLNAIKSSKKKKFLYVTYFRDIFGALFQKKLFLANFRALL